jgi:hypothetical protein
MIPADASGSGSATDDEQQDKSEPSASPVGLFISTTLALWWLDTLTGIATQIDGGKGVYYGITFSADRLYVACRQAEFGSDRDTQDNSILVFDCGLHLIEVIKCPFRIRDVHQIVYHADLLHIVSSYDDAIVQYDILHRQWRTWYPFGAHEDEEERDQHHINSVWFRGSNPILLGLRPNGWVAEFDKHRHQIYRKEFGSGSHNVWEQGGQLWTCSSNEGAIVSEEGKRIDIHPNAFVRGFATLDGLIYAGISQMRVRARRHDSDCSIAQITSDGVIKRYFSIRGYGLIHEIRTVGQADASHNSISFMLNDYPSSSRFYNIRTEEYLVDLERQKN